MNKRVLMALALCSALGAVAQTGSRSMPPPPIDVEVVDGRIAVAASGVRAGSGQVTLSWRILTSGYRFTNDSINFGDAGSYFSCSTYNNGQGIRCTKSSDAPAGRFRYSVSLYASEGVAAVQETSPNLWIQGE